MCQHVDQTTRARSLEFRMKPKSTSPLIGSLVLFSLAALGTTTAWAQGASRHTTPNDTLKSVEVKATDQTESDVILISHANRHKQGYHMRSFSSQSLARS